MTDNYLELEFLNNDEIGLEINNDDGINLDIDGSGSGGVTSYPLLKNKPSINGVTLVDDKTFEDLGVNTLTNLEIKAIFDRIFGGD